MIIKISDVNKEMDFETFEEVLTFLKNNKIGNKIIVDAYEDHSLFFKFFSHIICEYSKRFEERFSIIFLVKDKDNLDEDIRDIANSYPSQISFINDINNIKIEAKTPLCTNYRLMQKQIKHCTLSDIEGMLNLYRKYIYPVIDVDGNIKLGNNDCPICSNIYREESKIIEDIDSFTCIKCAELYNNIPDNYKKVLESKKEE